MGKKIKTEFDVKTIINNEILYCNIWIAFRFSYNFADMSSEQWDKLLENNGWNNVSLRDARYDQVIHLVRCTILVNPCLCIFVWIIFFTTHCSANPSFFWLDRRFKFLSWNWDSFLSWKYLFKLLALWTLLLIFNFWCFNSCGMQKSIKFLVSYLKHVVTLINIQI